MAIVKEKGKKFDQEKTRYELLSPIALEYYGKVATFGAAKYGDHNWRKGLKWTRLFGAIMRHLWAWMRGEDIDLESGLPHLAHALWGCASLLEYTITNPELDDRWGKLEK